MLTLQSIPFSCSDLNRRCGSKSVFEVDIRYHDCGHGLICTDGGLACSVGYEAFREDIETMTDDRTPRELFNAAEWTEAGCGNSFDDDDRQSVDANVGNREA